MKTTLLFTALLLIACLIGCSTAIPQDGESAIVSDSVTTTPDNSDDTTETENKPSIESQDDVEISEDTTESTSIPLPVNGGDLTFVSKFAYPVYNIADVAEIVGNEKTGEWTNNVFLKLSPEEQEELPVLYRIITDLGITKESLLNVAQGDQDLTEDIINALYLEDIEEMKQALTNPTALYYDKKIYTFDEISKDANAAIDVPKEVLSEYIDFIETVCQENNLIKYMQEEIDSAREINGLNLTK